MTIHIFSSPGQCTICRRDKQRPKIRAYYHANREEISRKRREKYRKEHPVDVGPHIKVGLRSFNGTLKIRIL